MIPRFWAVSCVLLAGVCSMACSGKGAGPFERGWVLSGEGTRVESYLGRRALRMRRGRAINREIRLRDGTIDVQMACSGRRSFALLDFRMEGDDDHEHIYFRPHKSSLADAIQYAPVWRGESYWQFFHGPGGTAPVEIPRDRWIPVRVVVSGVQAAVFVEDMTTPRLIVPVLAREAREGYVALSSLVPQGSAPPGELPVSFADVVVRPGYVPYDFSKAPSAPTAPAGTIPRWQVSPSFAPEPGPIRQLPPSILEGSGFTTLGTDGTGRVLLFRERARIRADERTAVLARVTLDAATPGVRRLHLGYSDEVTVFLDGQPLFSGDASYRHDNPRQDGVVSLSQATVYLPLRKGRNDLVLAVADVFGGWGFVGQLQESEGVTAVVPSSP